MSLISVLRDRFVYASKNVDADDLQILLTLIDESIDKVVHSIDSLDPHKTIIEQHVKEFASRPRNLLNMLFSCNIYVSQYRIKQTPALHSMMNRAVAEAVAAADDLVQIMEKIKSTQSWRTSALKDFKEILNDLTRVLHSVR